MNSHVAWQPGWNTAICSRGRDHEHPAEHCRCGFYLYADPVYAAEQPPARDVLAVVAAHGTMEVGTRGARARHARIQAVWLSPRTASELAKRVRTRYPSVAHYRNRDTMLAEHSLTTRPEFRTPRLGPHGRHRMRRAMAPLAATTIAVGLLPTSWTTRTPAAALALLSLLAAAIAIAATGVLRRTPQLTLRGTWQLAWLVSLRSTVSLLLLLGIAGPLIAASRYTRRIGAPIRRPHRRRRRWRGRWLPR